MTVSKLDQVYRRILIGRFFSKGWGEPDNLRRLFKFRKLVSNRETCRHLVSPDYPVTVDREELNRDFRVLEGHFRSPFADHLPGLLPPEAETAYFQLLLPRNWTSKHRPVCLNLAGTGDHYFWRRRNLMARPLLKEAGIASLLLENPFYGLRKPKEQYRSNLRNVSDIFVMGGSLVLESIALLHWCERQGFGPLGLTGVSMGGHMASLAATNWHKPIVLVPCLSWSTASGVFTKGVMSSSIDWELLEDQFLTDHFYREEIQKMLHPPQDDAFRAGQHFAKHYPSSMDRIEGLKTVCDWPQSTPTIRSLDEQLEERGQGSEGKEELQSAESYLRSKGVQMSQDKNSQQSVMLTVGSAQVSSFQHQLQRLLGASRILGTFTRSKSRLLNGVESDLDSQQRSRKDALQFMRGIMDECTHLCNFSVPVDPSLVIVVTARDDGYVPRDGVADLRDLWQGIQLRYVDTGHVAAFLLHQDVFRKAVADAFKASIEKYWE